MDVFNGEQLLILLRLAMRVPQNNFESSFDCHPRLQSHGSLRMGSSPPANTETLTELLLIHTFYCTASPVSLYNVPRTSV
jgi:hypothetical protein